MKILVTGAGGQLGSDVVACLRERNVDCIGTHTEDMDVARECLVREVLLRERPDAVIHCAAYTAVDRAEEEEALCRQVNITGTENIARVCGELDIKLLYISTDYVFPGTGSRPYETYDRTGPLSVYGRTKLEGERAVRALVPRYFIVRVSWIFGRNGNNFVKTMLKLGTMKQEINVVDDQIGSPTYTRDLASLLYDIIKTEEYGIYHASNEGYCSWAEFAEEIFNISGLPVKVNRIPGKLYPSKAARPQNSRLSKQSLDDHNFSRLPGWKDALIRYIKEINV